MTPQPGQQIRVYNSERQELGEGTLVRIVEWIDLNLTVYECLEHTILAKGRHTLDILGGAKGIPRDALRG